MWSFLGYALAVIFALLMLAILGLFIGGDIISAKEYIKANRVTGNIVGKDGESETANYGLLQPATKYSKYVVEYSVDGEKHQGMFLSKKKDLENGVPVEVRYVLNKDGEPEIVNGDRKDRLFRLAFVCVITIPLCVLIIVYLRNR